MNLTDQGIKAVAKAADSNKNINLMFLCQILMEVRDIKKLLEQSNYADNSCNNCSDSTDDGTDQNG